MNHISVNITAQSDFETMETVCKTKPNQKPTCADMNVTHNQCLTTLTLKFNNTLGCDYTCSFRTEKRGYPDAHSVNFNNGWCERIWTNCLFLFDPLENVLDE